MFTELSLGCWLSVHRNLCIHQVSSSTVFNPLCQLHAHTCPFYNVLLKVVCCCFPNIYILLNMPMFVGSQSFISLLSFKFGSVAVSEIRELNQNKKEKKEEKKNSEIGYFQYITFPGI